MKTETCVAGDPVWTNGVEILSNDECLPVIGSCQVSSILSTLDTTDKTLIGNGDVSQTMDIIILQNSDFKLSDVALNHSQESNYMILKDNEIEQKTNINEQENDEKNKSTNLEDLLYFVCNLCPFLCTSNEKISEHLQNAHTNKTVRKQQQLKCPACQNIFYHKISLRSHLIHDHGVSNSDINKVIQAVVYYAKLKTVKTGEKKQLKNKSKDNLKPEKSVANKYIQELSNNNKCNSNSNVEKINNAMHSTSDNKFSSILPQVNIYLNKTEEVAKQVPPNTSINQSAKSKNVHVCLFPTCKVKMHDVNKFQYHIYCHTDTGFKCLECPLEFALWNALTSHLWRIHKIDMELHSCNECDYKTHSLSNLNTIHKLIHTNLRNFVCNICQKAFKNRKQLRNHKAIHKEKSDKTSNECSACCRKFSNSRQTKLHMDTVHKKVKPFLCSFCGYKTTSRSSLKAHGRQHTGEKPFSCDTCSFTTADHNSLRRHKLWHTGEKPYKCEYCSYACIQSSTFKVHLKTKHPGQENYHMYTCKECQYRSINKELYNTHIASVHKQKPD